MGDKQRKALMLLRTKKQMKTGQVAAALEMSTSSASHLLARLCERGLVRHRWDPGAGQGVYEAVDV